MDAMQPWSRPKAIFVHSYGPPSCVNAEPTSDVNSMYGATNTTARSTSQRNAWGPFDATEPSVSRPTNAQTVKNHMSNLRSDLTSFAFSASANAVVCSTATFVAMLRSAPPLGFQ